MQGSSHEKFGVFLYSGPSPRVLFDSQTTSIILKGFFWGGGVCLGFWELASLQLFIVKSSITPLKLRLVKSACGNSSALYRTFVQTKYILFKILPTNSQFIYLFFIYTKS